MPQPNGRHFIVRDGERSYFRTRLAARAAEVADEQVRMTAKQRAIDDTRIAVRVAVMMDQLLAEGRESEADNLLWADSAERILPQGGCAPNYL